MRTMALLLLATSPMWLAACAATGGHPALADANEAHATLQELLQGEIDDSHIRTRLVRIDGRPVLEGNRRTFYLDPGTHVLGFELDVESLEEFESGRGSNFPDPSISAASVDEKSIDVDLDTGERYTFGAHIEDYNYAGWTPFVVESDALD